MKRILAFLTKHMGKQQTKPLGRWNLDYSVNIVNQKIDLSNEDHCGPCGQYGIQKQEAPETNIKKQQSI